MRTMKLEHFHELCDTLMHTKNHQEMMVLLKDLLSPKELTSIIERLQIIKLLARGVPQREISTQLKVSISKITRGSKALKFSRGGFRRFALRPKLANWR